MRHKIKTNRLDRFSSLRKATINSLSRALFLGQSIKTTYARAEAASGQIERLISLAKENSLASKRRAYRALQDHRLVRRLFGEIADLFKDRKSGFTRILKLGKRRGDGAQMVIFELTDKKEKPKKEKAHKKEEAAHLPQAPRGAPLEDKSKTPQKKEPPKRFLGGIKNIFKKERDSL